MIFLRNPTLDDFGIDPWWLIVIKVLGVFVVLVLLTLFSIWAERRVVAKMQIRVGPNRVGPFGLLQSLMDGIKLALKEDLVPKNAARFVFLIAPVISVTAAFMALAVIPFGPMVSIFGVWTPLQLTDFSVSVLYVLAIASVGIYGLVLAGWASGSTYSLLGGLRSFYTTSMVGETNRAPFDLPEAEGELVGGFHTEYSSLKFALFFLAEYVNMVTVSALATTLFLGGWRAPWPFSGIPGANEGWMPLIWFFGKLLAFIFIFIWLRGTLPRLRYDQFMNFGWKTLIPVSLGWIMVVAVARTLIQESVLTNTRTLIILAAPIALLLLLSIVVEMRKKEPEIDELEVEVLANSFPIPPMSAALPKTQTKLAVENVRDSNG